MTRAQLTFRAGLSRILLGVAALVMLPLAYPRTRAHIWVVGVYLALAAVEEVLIHRQVGERIRPWVAGLFDVMIITFLVHRLGSSVTVVASIYFFAGILNALVVGLHVGVTFAVINALAYSGVVWAEYWGLIPFAPDAPELAPLGRPTFAATATASSLVTVLLVSTVTVVGLLVRLVHTRERDLEAANAKLEELSQRDPLTGLYNRRHLLTRIDLELARRRRGHPFACIMLDLDGFKHINDQQGHPRGDDLLREIGASLVASTRAVDVAARYGGDEFMLILADTDDAAAQVVADRVVASVREVGTGFDPARPVTASIGVTLAREDDTVVSIVRRADDNAYRAKQAGGDRGARDR